MFSLQHCEFLLGTDYRMQLQQLTIAPGQHTVLLGPNGSGKSALSAILAGEGQCQSGEFVRPSATGKKVAWVSTEQQKALIEAEKRKDDADILDVLPNPSSARDIIQREFSQWTTALEQQLQQLATVLQFSQRLDTAFLALSTGESRKVLILRALLSQPDYLILDEPYNGLDAASEAALRDWLQQHQQQFTLILVTNRYSEIPSFTRQLLYLNHGALAWQNKGQGLDPADLAELSKLSRLQNPPKQLPAKDQDRFTPPLPDGQQRLVRLRNGKVHYDDRVVFQGLNWQVNRGEHWQIVGPNGSGKTCLLSMLTGDNPHCYTNDLEVVGYQRGQGESIWDIKKHIGLISNSLQLQYRVSCPVLHVVLSGFYDSIGLYEQPTLHQTQLAQQWLELIALADQAQQSFQQLSFGDQRLVLIARAMVKHPSLLILDEPCNGLDPLNRLKVLALLTILSQQGETTLLYVNHHPDDKIAGIERVLDMTQYQAAT